MNKEQFLKHLKNSLIGLDEETKKEIIYDYEEHFSEAIAKGRSEEQVVESLGDPKRIASQYMFEKAIDRAESRISVPNILRAILAGIGLSLFNLIFVFGLYIGIVATIFAMSISSVALVFAGLVGMVQSFLPFELSWFGTPFVIETIGSRILLFFIGIGFVVLGSILLVIFIKVGKWVYKYTIKYLKANLEIVKKAGF